MVHIALIDRLWVNLDQVGAVVPPSLALAGGEELPTPGVWIGGVYHVLSSAGYHKLLKYLAPDMVPDDTSDAANAQLSDTQLEELQERIIDQLDQRRL